MGISEKVQADKLPEVILKKLVLTLLKRNYLYTAKDYVAEHSDKITYKELVGSLYGHQVKELESIGVELPLDLTPQISRNILINLVLERWLGKAFSMGLAVKETVDGECSGGARHTITEITKYSISANGFETALRLQEHDDSEQRYLQQEKENKEERINNERRFQEQKDISVILKKNSSESVETAKKSVMTAKIALCISIALVGLGIWRVYKLEQKILSHEAMEVRIQSLEAKLNKPKEKKSFNTIITY